MKKHKIAVVIILVLLATFMFACKDTDFSVNFNGNGGTLVSGEISQTIEEGGSATAPVFTKEGYTLSWDKAFDNVTEEMTVTAVWTIKTYNVTFSGNGGTFVSGEAEQTIEHGSAATAPVFTKEGYDLSWDKDFDNVTEEMTVTAVWTIKTYAVTFDGNGGTFVSGEVSQTIEEGGSATAPVFTQEGYILSWDKAFDNVTEEMTVTAVWIKTYSVTFDGNGGEYISGEVSQTIADGSAATAPVFTKEGYTLTWDKAVDNVTEDMTVTAVWLAKVEYVTNGGSEIESNLVEPGTKVSEPECNREVYIIEGWYTSSNGGETLEEMWSFDTNIVQTNLILYAKWVLPFTYAKNGGNVYMITGLTEVGSSKAALQIPAEIEGTRVMGISSSAFENNTQITSIKILEGINAISDRAFYGCTGLSSITIADSIRNIGNYAFSGCSGLTTITIPKNVGMIRSYAFSGCSGLTTIIFPDSLTEIGFCALAGCNALTSITIPYVGYILDGTTQTHFGHLFGAFSYGDNYKSVPASLKSVIITGGASISGYAFSDCRGLTSITIPASVTSIGSRAFERCSGLISITVAEGNTTYHINGNCIIETASETLIQGFNNSVIPSDGSVTSIASYAFYESSGLTSITIPESITSINDCAFFGCSGLTSITIPDSVISLGNEVFARCNGLESITVDAENSAYKSDGNNLIDKATNALLAGCKNSVIPTDGSVTTIGSRAFSDCSELTSITIPAGVTSIGNYAFLGCSGLTSIAIPASVTSIGREAFAGCFGLNSITVEEGNTKYGSNGNCLIEKYSKTLIAGCKNSVIPTDGSVKTIGVRAFSGITSLTSIIIPDNVTCIDAYAFTGCSGLTSIIIPTSVTSINVYAFYGCSELTIYVRAASKPSGWHNSWIGSDCPVVWGYEG